MPHKHQAIKDLRKTKKRSATNTKAREDIKTLIKKARKAIVAKEPKTEELVKDIIKKLDKATQKGLMKKNTGSRRKSRLVKMLNKSKKS